MISISDIVMEHDLYKDVNFDREFIQKIITEEIEKFKKTLGGGLKQFEKGLDPFILFSTYGFPFELTKELAGERGIILDEKDFQEKLTRHQELSRKSGEKKFKND